MHRFNTIQGGSYFGVGIGGPITGRGAHLLLIDDPVKNREEAESETKRRSIKDWYVSTAYPRLMPGGAIILIQAVGDSMNPTFNAGALLLVYTKTIQFM
jgi:hypothetical protein